jgi:nucleotide-binding universal stress UspA family protein
VFDKVLLAVDGSAHACRAVPVAVDLAKKSGGEVVILHAREFRLAKGVAYTPEDSQEATTLVDRVRDQIAAAGVPVRGRVVTSHEGRAAQAILEAAEIEEADAIVMGSRGLSELAGLLLGSVAHKVIQLSHCPVVVAR